MTTFEKQRHVEIDENYQGINLTEFSISVDNQTDSDQIVDTFIRTNQFSFESLRDCVKANPKKGYLRQAFDIDKIRITDFKKTNRAGTEKFLIDFLNGPDWADDRNEFAKLLNKFFEAINLSKDSDFYIISKDWFDTGDERVKDPESWIYTYYFLIISVDKVSNILTVTEWTYD